jgi:hydroxymethylglutaryl-CoA reductase
MDRSRIPGFYKLSISERLNKLNERKVINEEDYLTLLNNLSILQPEEADKMIENVVTVFGMPLGLGLNFLANGKDYIIPMVVEEPSIVAAISSAAKIVRQSGGFICESDDPVLIGQIQIVDLEKPSKAQTVILQNKKEIINLANSLHPNMFARGGGAKDIEVKIHPSSTHRGDMVVVHLLVDTRDAMGANLVNSMCEGVASLIEKITGGKVFLRILSNLTDRALVKASCTIPCKLLKGKGYSGEDVRDGIILATEFASVDPYRAATHNKGIMNGIDPVAIATGNDWRAIEAAAHAYAARGNHYTSLSKWDKNENGDLVGSIKIPMKVGIVGGPLESNPAVEIAHRILNVETATELARVIAAVGLAQNFSALRALSTEGIQQGHMTLHARSVANAAGAYPEIFDTVVEELLQNGEVKIWKAKEIIKSLESKKKSTIDNIVEDGIKKKDFPSGHGKVILLGEHAVVYGSHAIAGPVPLAMQAKVWDSKNGIHLLIPRWGIEEKIRKNADHKYSIYKSLDMILERLQVENRSMKIEVFPHVPRAMGLGGSAALAVAIIRALDEHFKLNLSNEDVYDISFESENIIHGSASGIDNSLATYGKFTLFQKGEPPKMENIKIKKKIPIVIGLSGVESLTAKMVTNVNHAWQNNKKRYEKIFKQIDELTLEALEAIKKHDLQQLGELMNINQGLLNALQVSSRELEELIEISRRNGALGAKLTGGGGGGAMIALAPENSDKIIYAMRKAGYRAIPAQIG